MLRDDIQILLLLDLASDNPLGEEEVIGLMPDARRERRTFRLTEFGARPGPRGTPEDWDLTGRALAAMISAARYEIEKIKGNAHFYIAGRAALPVFAAAGFLLSKWAEITVLNQRPTKEWDKLAMREADDGADPPFFTIVEGLDPSRPLEASGDIALFLSTSYRAARDQLREFVSASGHSLAGIVEATTTDGMLEGADAARVAQQVTEILTKARATYPYATGIALFLAAPGSLAFIAGRAINPNIVGTTLVPNFQARTYVDALSLPLSDASLQDIPTDPQSISERQAVLDELVAAFADLKIIVTPDAFPPWMSPGARTRFVRHLAELEIQGTPEGSGFYLDVIAGQVMLGSSLLEALRPVDPSTRRRIGQNLLLHEVYHNVQGLRSTTYRGVGRAGFALEEVDYSADAFAVGLL
ncbi:MAG: SAVED domain-containing protein, partial [bacterium]